MTTEIIVTDQPRADAITLQNNDQIRKAVDSLNTDVTAAAAAASARPISPAIVDADIDAAAAIEFSKMENVAWTSWSPTMSIGTWANTGFYTRIGRTILATARAFFNGAAGVGTYALTLPVDAENTHGVVGHGNFWDNSASEYYNLILRTASASTINFIALDINFIGSAYSYVPFTNATPITPAASDFFECNFSYQAVS